MPCSCVLRNRFVVILVVLIISEDTEAVRVIPYGLNHGHFAYAGDLFVHRFGL
jgi:hypothetical protein